MIATSALFWLTATLYALAGLLYMSFLLGAAPAISRAARLVMWLAFLSQLLELSRRGIQGLHPVSSSGEAVGFLAWVMVGAFLAAQLRGPLDAVGTLVAPAAAALLGLAYLSPEFGGGSTEGLGVLGRVHILLAVLGTASFALAAALAALFLVEERQLKRRRPGRAVERGTALETLDRLLQRTVQLGLPLFTLALLSGAWWTAQRSSGMQLQYALAVVAWVAFGGLLVARHTAGWRGRRAALLAITGFAATVAVLGVYLSRGGGS